MEYLPINNIKQEASSENSNNNQAAPDSVENKVSGRAFMDADEKLYNSTSFLCRLRRSAAFMSLWNETFPYFESRPLNPAKLFAFFARQMSMKLSDPSESCEIISTPAHCTMRKFFVFFVFTFMIIRFVQAEKKKFCGAADPHKRKERL